MLYRISAPAEEDMIGIWQYTFKAWGQEQADLYIDTIILRFQWLTENPTVWQSRAELFPGLHSFNHKSHVIFFLIDENDGVLQVLRVLHQRMDFERHLMTKN